MDACNGFFEFSKCDLPATSFSIFEEMRDSEELCDVTIIVKNESFPAHRIVLSAAVPYFRAMFRSKMEETIKREIHMDNSDPVAIKTVINFAYTGKMRIDNNKVQSLLEMAIYLQLDSVTNACFQFFLKELSPDNVLCVRALAETANHINTIEHADRFVRENFDEVSLTESFLDLPPARLKELIRRDDLNVTSEEVVFEAVVRWVKAVEIDRRAYLKELLRNVRIFCLTSQYLNRVCLTDDLFKMSQYRDMLNEVNDYLRGVMNNPWNFVVPERYCKEKHHLKCQKLMGSGMYSIVKGTFSSNPCLLDYLLNHSLCYYEFEKEEWIALQDVKEIGSFNYVICMEEKIHFIRTGLIHTFHLKTLESVSVKCKNIPLGSGIVLHDGNAYILGSGKDSSGSVCHFDLQLGTSRRVGQIMTCRTDMGLASLGEHIYITGGENSHNKISLQSAERFHPSTGESVEISPMLFPRSGHGCAALGGKLYVCGGGTDSAEVYDPVTDQWKFIAPMSRTRNRVSLVSYNQKLYAIDIISETNKFAKEVEIFDPGDPVWKIGKPIPFEHAIVVVTNSATTLQY